MKIFYIGESNISSLNIPQDQDFLALHFDNWDDFTVKTRFPTTCRIKGTIVELGAIKILFKAQSVSWKYLKDLSLKGWNGEFPITDGVNYVSVPEELEFYSLLISKLSVRKAKRIALALRDASVLQFLEKTPEATELCDTSNFRISLLRDISSQRAYSNIWKIFNDNEIKIDDFSSFTQLNNDVDFEISYKFNHQNLPSNLNVIIGPNGIGKTQTLVQLTKNLISPSKEEARLKSTDNLISFGKIIALSYSPFDNFPIDLESFKGRKTSKSLDTYKYFGFRKRKRVKKTIVQDSNEEEKARQKTTIEFDLDTPKLDASLAIKHMAHDDIRFASVDNWPKKVSTAKRLLKKAIPQLSQIGLLIPRIEKILGDDYKSNDHIVGNKAELYLRINQSTLKTVTKIPNYRFRRSKIFLFDEEDKTIELSSGQRIFTYIVLSLLGDIDLNSLILIDEPELFLHPSLEIELIGLINSLLKTFNSKAILSTHSLVAVRETPSRAVHVLRYVTDTSGAKSIQVTHPPFETLGGDLQRISSYVFGDQSTNKPFEDWLRTSLREAGSADALIEILGENINEELIIQIYALEEEL